MKHHTFRNTILVALFALVTTACSKEDTYNWDFRPENICIQVLDENGTDLLNKENPNHILDQEIVVIYNDKKYKPKRDKRNTNTLMDEWEQEGEDNSIMRSQSPRNLALRYYEVTDVVYPKAEREYCILTFGEFTQGYKDESFTISWGDGTEDEIRFDYYIKGEDSAYPRVYRKLFINGDQYKDGTCSEMLITLTK